MRKEEDVRVYSRKTNGNFKCERRVVRTKLLNVGVQLHLYIQCMF